jgi:hypothetical protein
VRDFGLASRADCLAATAEIPPIPAVTTRGSQLTLRANYGTPAQQQKDPHSIHHLGELLNMQWDIKPARFTVLGSPMTKRPPMHGGPSTPVMGRPLLWRALDGEGAEFRVFVADLS